MYLRSRDQWAGRLTRATSAIRQKRTSVSSSGHAVAAQNTSLCVAALVSCLPRGNARVDGGGGLLSGELHGSHERSHDQA